jgi:hypothetical protein
MLGCSINIRIPHRDYPYPENLLPPGKELCRGWGRLKGTEPRHASIFSIRPAYQGILSGKRAGCTQNLSSAARHKTHTREVENASVAAPPDSLSAAGISKSSEILVRDGGAAASRFSLGDAHSVALGCNPNRVQPNSSRRAQNGTELRVPSAEVIAEAIKIYRNDRHGRWRVGNYLPSGRRRQQSYDISHADVSRLLRSLWPSYITDQARIADRCFDGDINRVTPRWQSRLEAALDREVDARRAYDRRREKWEQKQRERERVRRERMPSEQRRELERKEHDERMKAINAELDEREKASAARALMEVRSHVRHGRLNHVQHLLTGIAEMGPEGVTVSNICYIVVPRGAHLLSPEQRERWGREIAKALVVAGVLAARGPDRFARQENAVLSRDIAVEYSARPSDANASVAIPKESGGNR